MPRRLTLLLALLALPARPQAAMLRAHLDRTAGAAPARLLILEPPRSRALQTGFQALLRSPALRGFQVPVQAFDLGTPLGREQAASLRSGAQGQWFLLGPSGEVKARGTTIPDAEAFAKVLGEAGFQDLARALGLYLRQVPDSLSARERLLAELRERGERTAQRLMGLTVESPRERLDRGDVAAWRKALGDPTAADLSTARGLSAPEDLDAWGPFAQALEEAFRQGLWLEMDFAWTREGRPLDAASPTLRGLYTRWLPAVEGPSPANRNRSPSGTSGAGCRRPREARASAS